MEVVNSMQHNALTGSSSVNWNRKQAEERERKNQQFVATRHLSSVAQVKRAIRSKYELAGAIDRGPAFRRMRASCGGQLDLGGFRHFLNLSGIYVTNPAGRDLVRELWESKRSISTGVIEFPAFAELCFGNEPIMSDMGGTHENEQSQLARVRNRTKFQDSQADSMYQSQKPDHFAVLRDKLQRRGKRSFSEKFATLQLLASYKDSNLRKDGFALALKKLGMKLTPRAYDDMFRKCDLNGNGEIDFAEFCAVIMNAPGYTSVAKAKVRGDPGSRAAAKSINKKNKVVSLAAARQRIAERGHHLIKSVPELREKVTESFNKLNSGSSAAASFRRLKTTAGAVIDAVQFPGFIKYINMMKIPADQALVRKLFNKMLHNTPQRGTKKKTAFTFDDFKIEFFAQQATSAYQEEDHLFGAQMERIQRRTQAQELARNEMADRLGVELGNGFVAGAPGISPSSSFSSRRDDQTGRSLSQSPIRGAGQNVLGGPPGLPQATGLGSQEHGGAQGKTTKIEHLRRFRVTGEAQPVPFRALPNPHVASKIARAIDVFGGGITSRTYKTSRSLRERGQGPTSHGVEGAGGRRQVEIPRNGSKHTRADPRISLQVMLRKKGIRAKRRDVEHLIMSGSQS